MPGVKGKSGGKRAGSGRKPVMLLKADSDDALDFLRQVMREKGADGRLRLRAAVELAKIEKGAKPGSLGRKGAQTEAARAAGQGRFAQGSAPKLVVSNGK